jgi:hypothetical protein
MITSFFLDLCLFAPATAPSKFKCLDIVKLMASSDSYHHASPVESANGADVTSLAVTSPIVAKLHAPLHDKVQVQALTSARSLLNLTQPIDQMTERVEDVRPTQLAPRATPLHVYMRLRDSTRASTHPRAVIVFDRVAANSDVLGLFVVVCVCVCMCVCVYAGMRA